MITAIVMIDTDADKIPEVAEKIANIDGISEVYSVTGGADLVAIARVTKHEELAGVIADQLSKVSGVVRTQTHIAFRSYSRHDLAQAFDLGLGD